MLRRPASSWSQRVRRRHSHALASSSSYTATTAAGGGGGGGGGEDGDGRFNHRENKTLRRRLAGTHVPPPRRRLLQEDPDHPSPIQHVDASSVDCNTSAYGLLVRQCGRDKNLAVGRHIHDCIIKVGLDHSSYLQNLLLHMYGRCGLVQDAHMLFANLHERDEFAWNFMIRIYSQAGHSSDASQLFNRMQVEAVIPNMFIYTNIILACSTRRELLECKRLHTCIASTGLISDVSVANALVTIYNKCGLTESAREVFDSMNEQDVVSWNAMIAGYPKRGQVVAALQLFKQMTVEAMLPNMISFTIMIDACGTQGLFTEGQLLHACIASTDLELGTALGTALVNMYAKAGKPDNACLLFNSMYDRNVISWNGIMSAYAIREQAKDSLVFFNRMLQEGVMPEEFIFATMLSAHSTEEVLAEGKRLHSRIVGSTFEFDTIVCTAVVNMYCKCGSMANAQRMFDNIEEPDEVLWTAMIAGYAKHGQGKAALRLLDKMQNKGVQPSKVTFVSVLAACNHSGLVDEAFTHFLAMSRDHGIAPTVDHYNCIVDLLGKLGRLDDAEELIRNMSCQPTTVTWLCLLGACTKLTDVERAERAARRILESDTGNISPYIYLLHVYSQQPDMIQRQ